MSTRTIGLAALLLTTTLGSGYAALGDLGVQPALKAESLPGLQLARKGADDGPNHDVNDDKGGGRDDSNDDSSSGSSDDDGVRGDGSTDDNSSSNDDDDGLRGDGSVDDNSSANDDDGDDDRRGRGSDDGASSSDDSKPGKSMSDDRKRIDLKIRDGEIRVRTRGLTEEEEKKLQEEILRRLQGM